MCCVVSGRVRWQGGAGLSGCPLGERREWPCNLRMGLGEWRGGWTSSAVAACTLLQMGVRQHWT
jgi:hypothetical protein